MAAPVKITHLSTVHPRYDTRIFAKECVTLQENGYDVSLVIADGLGDETTGAGIDIHDIGKPSGRRARMLMAPLRAFRRVRKLSPALVHIHDPELLPIAVLLRLCGYKVIYDAHEDLPRAVLSKEWIRPGLRKLVSHSIEVVEDFCAARMSAMVCATPFITERFRKVAKIAEPVANFPVQSELAETLDLERQPGTFAYVGVITRHRGAFEMVKAAAQSGSRLVMAGRFENDALERDLKAMPEWAAVDYLGMVNRQQVREVMSSASAGLLFFYPEPNHINALPNKMFEYMSASLPILCSDFDFWKPFVINEGVGYNCDPKDAKAIAALMTRINEDPNTATQMGHKGRALVLERFNWTSESRTLLDLYARCFA